MAKIERLQERAAEDFRDELILERQFKRGLRSVNTRLANASALSVLQTGAPVNVEDEQGVELPLFLLLYYQRVLDKFKGRTGIKPTESEQAIMDGALRRFTEERASVQAKFIMDTSQHNSERALEITKTQRDLFARDGKTWSDRETASAYRAVLDRRLHGREGNIATVETGAVAEASKLTEVEVLMGVAPFIIAGASSTPLPTVKEWVSMGDSVVRQHHLIADSIQVPSNQPFIVNNERLMFPKDTSMGASPNNVMNCRCKAIHDIVSVAQSRQDLNPLIPKAPPPKPPKPPSVPKPKRAPKPKPMKIPKQRHPSLKPPPNQPVMVKATPTEAEFIRDPGLAVKVTGKLTEIQKLEVQWYQNDGAVRINAALRQKKLPSGGKAQLKSINGAIKKSELIADTTLYRGVNSNRIGAAIRKVKPGQKLNIVQFQSTSLSQNTGLLYAGGAEENVMFRIHAKAGTKALNIEGASGIVEGAAEILLSNEASYVFRSVGRLKRVLPDGTTMKGFADVTVIDVDYIGTL